MTDHALLDELTRDIWRPFRHTFRVRDLEGFLALYHPDLIRAGGPAKEVYGFDRLVFDTTGWFAEVSERGDSLDIEFRFTERIAADELASERGYYRITVTLADTSDRVRHGRFHTFACKVDGRWRIVVDYDTEEGGPVPAEMFAAGAAADDTARF